MAPASSRKFAADQPFFTVPLPLAIPGGDCIWTSTDGDTGGGELFGPNLSVVENSVPYLAGSGGRVLVWPYLPIVHPPKEVAGTHIAQLAAASIMLLFVCTRGKQAESVRPLPEASNLSFLPRRLSLIDLIERKLLAHPACGRADLR